MNNAASSLDRRRRRIIFWILAVTVAAAILWPLVLPTKHAVPRPQAQVSLEKATPVDFYLLRDASGSPDAKSYQEIQDQVWSHIRTDAVDRASFSWFGSSTLPHEIQAASRYSEALESFQGLPCGSSGGCPELNRGTDFALVFNKIRTALEAEWRSDRAATEQDPNGLEAARIRDHFDVVVLLTDGVHDPQGRRWQCPEDAKRASQEFVPPGVRVAFKNLVASAPFPDRLRIFLVLAGEETKCGTSIATSWREALSEKDGLNVLLRGEIKTNKDFVTALFEPMAREAGFIVQPSLLRLDSSQRALFDRGELFSAYFQFSSFLNDGTLRVRGARLMRGVAGPEVKNTKGTKSGVESSDEDRLITFLEVRDGPLPEIAREEPRILEIHLPAPAPGATHGPTDRRCLHFTWRDHPLLDEGESYYLELAVEAEDGLVNEVKTNAGLSLEPTPSGRDRARARRLLVWVFRGLVLLWCLVLIDTLLWELWGGTRQEISPTRVWFYSLTCAASLGGAAGWAALKISWPVGVLTLCVSPIFKFLLRHPSISSKVRRWGEIFGNLLQRLPDSAP